uniref:UDENN domain-containing protein n=1 Tax=Panagrolaimus sp. JU765 TaxID=591449 RepID=A0AC34QBW4_9BILA
MSEWSKDKNGSIKNIKSFTLGGLRRDFPRGSKTDDDFTDSKSIGIFQNSGSFVKRARLIRRRTTCKMTKTNKDDISVVQQVLVVRLKQFNDATNQETKFLSGSKSCFVPFIYLSHPKIESGDKNYPPTLFFPDFTQEVYYKPTNEQICHYTVMMTDDKGQRKFAYCYKYFIYSEFDSSDSGFDDSYLRNPMNYEVVVIISHFPVENTLRSMAYDMVKSLKRGHGTLEKLCSDLMHLTLTWNDRSIQQSQYLLSNTQENLFFQKPITNFVKNIGLEYTIYIFLCLLAEKRILITGNNIMEITESIQSIIKLLSPLEWPHTLVPILPDTNINLAYCPTPYIFGIMRYNLNNVKEIVCTSTDSFNCEDVIILDLKMGILKPLLQLNVVELHEKKKAVVIHAAKEMGYNSKIVEELFKLLKPIFTMKLKEDEFAKKFEKVGEFFFEIWI